MTSFTDFSLFALPESTVSAADAALHFSKNKRGDRGDIASPVASHINFILLFAANSSCCDFMWLQLRVPGTFETRFRSLRTGPFRAARFRLAVPLGKTAICPPSRTQSAQTSPARSPHVRPLQLLRVQPSLRRSHVAVFSHLEHGLPLWFSQVLPLSCNQHVESSTHSMFHLAVILIADSTKRTLSAAALPS